MKLREFMKLNTDNMRYLVHATTPWFDSDPVFDSAEDATIDEKYLDMDIVYLFVDPATIALIVEIA